MSAVRFKITTHTGRSITGTVKSNGGFVGFAFGHLEPERRNKYALGRMELAVRKANEGRPLGSTCLEYGVEKDGDAPTGLVEVYPEYGRESDGPMVIVCLKGARVEVAVDPPTPRQKTIWDLPMAKRMWQADARDSEVLS